MKNKKIFLMIMMIIVFGMLSLMAFAGDNQPSGYLIKVTLMSQEPDPVEPGDFVDVRFKFENIGWRGTDEVTVVLLPDYPFLLEPGESTAQYLGGFRAQQKGVEGVIVKYRLLVDKNAVEGDNELELRYRIGEKGAWIKPEPFNISVKPFDSIISVENVELVPEMIAPGREGILKLVIRNAADSVMKKITLKLDLTNVPLLPHGSSNEKTVSQINPGENATVEFGLIAGPKAESSLYKVPLSIIYKDELGRNYTRDNVIGVKIGEIPDLYPIIESSEVYKSGQTGIVSIKFVNKGVSDVKFVNVKLRETDYYEIVSASQDYIGNIDSDDYESAEYKIFLKKGKDSVKLPIEVDYLSANNEEFQKLYDLELKLWSESEAKKIGLSQGGGSFGYVLVLIIVGAGVYFYLRWKKGKKKKNA